MISDFKILKTIGEGTFGKVKSAEEIKTGQKVSIKILNKNKIQGKENMNQIIREIKILKELNHPNLIKLYQIIEDNYHFFIVTEYASGGELFNLIVKNKHLSENDASIFFTQLIFALEFLKIKNISHRDIKPENILIRNNKELLLIDFGLSCQFNEGELINTPCGSPCYAAPEMLLGNNYNGLASDIWSCGIVLFTMVCGYLPFEEETNEKLYKKIYSTKLEIPERISSQCKDLLNKLLVVNPKKRPSLEEIKNHKFLNYGVIWYKEHFCKIMKKYDLKKENINMDILDNMNQYGVDDLKENIINDILNNKHNRNTMIYYLLLDKYGVDWKYLKDSTNKLLVAKPSFFEKIKQKTLIEEDELECNLIDYISNISNNKKKKEETKNKVKEKREKLKHNNISYTQREMKSKLNISKNKNKDKENSLYLVNLKKKASPKINKSIIEYSSNIYKNYNYILRPTKNNNDSFHINYIHKTNSNLLNISLMNRQKNNKSKKQNSDKNNSVPKNKKKKKKHIIKDCSISLENPLCLTQCFEKDKSKENKLFIHNSNIKNSNINNNIYIQSEFSRSEKSNNYSKYKLKKKKKIVVTSLKHNTNNILNNFVNSKYSHDTNNLNVTNKNKDLSKTNGCYSDEKIFFNDNLTTRYSSNKLKYYLENIKDVRSKTNANYFNKSNILPKKVKNDIFTSSPLDEKKLNKSNHFIRFLNTSLKKRKFKTKVINIDMCKKNDKYSNSTNKLFKSTTNNEDNFLTYRKIDKYKNIKIKRNKTNSITIIKGKTKMSEYLENYKNLNKNKIKNIIKNGMGLKNYTTDVKIKNKSIPKLILKKDISFNINNNLSSGHFNSVRNIKQDKFVTTSINVYKNVNWIKLEIGSKNLYSIYLVNIIDIDFKEIEKKIKEICTKQKYKFSIKTNKNKYKITCRKNFELIDIEIDTINNINKITVRQIKGSEKQLLCFIRNIKFNI